MHIQKLDFSFAEPSFLLVNVAFSLIAAAFNSFPTDTYTYLVFCQYVIKFKSNVKSIIFMTNSHNKYHKQKIHNQITQAIEIRVVTAQEMTNWIEKLQPLMSVMLY